MRSDDLTLAQSGTELQAAREASTEAAPVPPELPGYRLDRLLGRGSFGEVWAGVQVRSGLRVAVKALTRREGLDWLYFKHEVGRLREVSEHPHVVSLLDADLSHDPPFFVMPLLSRGSLAGAERPDFGQAVAWIREIASALRFCHEKGLLHCDLKPSNVMLDEEGHVRLVDYGQSRLKGDRTVTWGTLGFMAPEQATQGDSVPSTRWDVYSLGATAYFLLTGRCPRLSEADRTELTRTEDTGRRLEQYRRLLRERPLVPIRKLHPGVDADLAAIVESCLALDPDERTDSVEDVLDDLERRASRDPLLCRRPWSTGYRLRRLLSKPRVALSLVFLSLLGGALVWAGVTVHRATTAQFQYDGGVVAEQRGDLQQAYLRWAVALENVPLAMPFKTRTWSVRFNARLPWVLAQRLGPPVSCDPGTSLAYSPDGTLLAAGYQDGRTLLIDPRSGESRPGPRIAGPVTQIVLDSENEPLVMGPTEVVYRGQTHPGAWRVLAPCHGGWAVGGEDGRVLRLPDRFELFTEKPVIALVGHGTRIAVAHPDQTVDLGASGLRAPAPIVALASVDGNLLAELSDGSIQNLTGHVELVESGQDVELEALDRNGDSLARSYQTVVRLRSLREDRLLPNLQHEDTVRRLLFSPDARYLATAAADRTARLWHVDNGSAASSLLRHDSQLEALAFSPDGRELATLTRLGMLSVWRQAPADLRRLEHPADVLAMDQHGDRLATGCADGAVRLFSLSRPGEPLTLPHGGRVLALAFAPDGRSLASASTDGTLRFWSSAGEALGELPTPGVVSALAWSGNRLAAACLDDILLIDPSARRLVHTLEAGDLASELVFSPDGRHLVASGVTAGKVTVWQSESGQNLHRLQHPDIVPSVDVSRDGRWFLTSCNDGRARRFELATGRPIEPYFIEEQPLHVALASPDRHRIAVAGDERSARVFPLDDDQAGPLLAHRDSVLGLAFNPDGRWVATGSQDGQARVWDSDSGLPLTSALDHPREVSRVAFSDDSQALVTLAGDTVTLWDLAPNSTRPERLRLATEVDAGLVLDGHQVRVLGPEEWRRKRQQLEP